MQSLCHFQCQLNATERRHFPGRGGSALVLVNGCVSLTKVTPWHPAEEKITCAVAVRALEVQVPWN